MDSQPNDYTNERKWGVYGSGPADYTWCFSPVIQIDNPIAGDLRGVDTPVGVIHDCDPYFPNFLKGVKKMGIRTQILDLAADPSAIRGFASLSGALDGALSIGKNQPVVTYSQPDPEKLKATDLYRNISHIDADITNTDVLREVLKDYTAKNGRFSLVFFRPEGGLGNITSDYLINLIDTVSEYMQEFGQFYIQLIMNDHEKKSLKQKLKIRASSEFPWIYELSEESKLMRVDRQASS